MESLYRLLEVVGVGKFVYFWEICGWEMRKSAAHHAAHAPVQVGKVGKVGKRRIISLLLLGAENLLVRLCRMLRKMWHHLEETNCVSI